MTLHIDRFSAGLDEMTRKDQADPVKVLRVLSKINRFSVFEATANSTIAATMDRLCGKEATVVDRDGIRHEYGMLIEIVGGEYPCTEIKITEGGKRLLADIDAGLVDGGL